MEAMEDASTVERTIIERAKKIQVPINGSLELLPLCNMNCEMCYVRLSKEEQMKQGTLHTADDYLKLAQEMVNAGTLFLLLTGGEPLLYPDFQKLFTGLKRMGLILTINTNGTLINEQWADFFAQHKPRRINITLYGASEQTYDKLCHYPGGLARVIHAVELLRARDIDVKLSISAVNANADEIPQMLDLGEKLGVPVHLDAYMMPVIRERSSTNVIFSRLTPQKAANAEFCALQRTFPKDFFDQYVFQTLEQIRNFVPSENRKMSCLAGSCSFTVNWQGNMRSCVVMDHPSVSVFDLGFQESWRTLREECDALEIGIACQRCNRKPVCRTCAAAAEAETGNTTGKPEYLCAYSDAYIELLEEYQRRNAL